MVLKEVSGLGAILDCASMPRRSSHPRNLRQRIAAVTSAHSSSQIGLLHRGDRMLRWPC